jgi:alkylation response protein AidB-like acyl-CoA dehydrogenase
MSAVAAPPAAHTRAAFRAFTDAEVVPHAGEWDRAGRISDGVIGRLAEEGWLGALLPAEVGGAAMDMATFGALNEELGRGCSSVRSLITVHSMVSFALHRWGSRAQKERWIARLAAGELIGAFALTEPEVGSDAASIASTAERDGDDYVLNGTKRWITFGQIADLFIVFAKSEGKPLALLVERDTPGFTATPITGVVGTRAAMLAELTFDGCRVPVANRLGGPGFGLGVAMTALEIGRFSVATGSVGILQACLEASLAYASERHQFGDALGKHQLVRRMITDMAAEVRAARLLCENAGRLYDAGDPAAREEIFIAKYFASTAAARAALDAMQIHGANGCTDSYPVERFLRDSRVMEVIEGSTQIMQITIAKQELEAFNSARA